VRAMGSMGALHEAVQRVQVQVPACTREYTSMGMGMCACGEHSVSVRARPTIITRLREGKDSSLLQHAAARARWPHCCSSTTTVVVLIAVLGLGR